jgi:hypothetical protein
LRDFRHFARSHHDGIAAATRSAMNRITTSALRLGLPLVALVATQVGCSSSTSTSSGPAATVSGDYSGNIVNGQSSCPGDWTVGNTAAVTTTVTQSGTATTVAVTGASGLFLQVALGADEFNGTVEGDTIDATLLGTAQQTQGACSYTWKADFSATLDDNALQGTVTYTPQTNSDPDCTSMSVQGCTRTQTFSGVRPAPSM